MPPPHPPPHKKGILLFSSTYVHVCDLIYHLFLVFQFESVALEAALYLLDKAELMDGARSNPVLIARTMSQMVRRTYPLPQHDIMITS